MGSGRIVFQEVTRISKAIKEALFHQFGIIEALESAQNHGRSPSHGLIVRWRSTQPYRAC